VITDRRGVSSQGIPASIRVVAIRIYRKRFSPKKAESHRTDGSVRFGCRGAIHSNGFGGRKTMAPVGELHQGSTGKVVTAVGRSLLEQLTPRKEIAEEVGNDRSNIDLKKSAMNADTSTAGTLLEAFKKRREEDQAIKLQRGPDTKAAKEDDVEVNIELWDKRLVNNYDGCTSKCGTIVCKKDSYDQKALRVLAHRWSL
jgi:hypothetical protein